MAMGNIGAANTAMATKAQMVGFVPRDSIKEVKKEEEHTTTIRELEEQDTDNKSRTDQDRTPKKNEGQVQTPDQKVRQRQISAPQQQRSQQTEEKSETSEAQRTPQGTEAAAGQRQGPRGPVAFDTSAQIQWKFNQAQTDQAHTTENPQTQPEVQKRQFLNRLQQMVKTEYQQYVKSDDALYSRRNLREIMGALNQDDPNSRRLKSEQDSRRADDVPSELEGYNKFNAMRASRSLQVVRERQEEPQQESLRLVA